MSSGQDPHLAISLKLSVEVAVRKIVGVCHVCAGCQVCGVCTSGGWQGGLALLSNLERSPLTRIMLRGLPAQGGFEAAYYGMCNAISTCSTLYVICCLQVCCCVQASHQTSQYTACSIQKLSLSCGSVRANNHPNTDALSTASFAKPNVSLHSLFGAYHISK